MRVGLEEIINKRERPRTLNKQKLLWKERGDQEGIAGRTKERGVRKCARHGAGHMGEDRRRKRGGHFRSTQSHLMSLWSIEGGKAPSLKGLEKVHYDRQGMIYISVRRPLMRIGGWIHATAKRES